VCVDKQPDLVLLDVVMPDMDGYQVLARLRADPATRDTPVIFVTAQDDVAAEARGLDAGAVDFIAKPIHPSVVRARVRTHLQLKAQADVLRQAAFIDGLTGVYNRRCFDARLADELRRSARNGAPLALVMADVDHFKRYNDRYGHQAGDDCLRRIAATLRATLRRPADLVARWGGEEFACLLGDTDAAGALDVAQHLEQAVRALRIAHADAPPAQVVTISAGVAAWTPGSPADAVALFAAADARLYAAKQAGRGRVCSEAG
jgi:diguanylate cyclase (GGDEF)-like protein